MNNYEKNYQNKKAKYKAYKAIWKLAHGKFGGDYQKAIKEVACLFEQIEKEKKAQCGEPYDNDCFGFMNAFDELCKPVDDYIANAKRLQV